MANEINLQQSDFDNPQKLKVLMKLKHMEACITR